MGSKKNGTKKIGPQKKLSKRRKQALLQTKRAGTVALTPPTGYRGKYKIGSSR